MLEGVLYTKAPGGADVAGRADYGLHVRVPGDDLCPGIVRSSTMTTTEFDSGGWPRHGGQEDPEAGGLNYAGQQRESPLRGVERLPCRVLSLVAGCHERLGDRAVDIDRRVVDLTRRHPV